MSVTVNNLTQQNEEMPHYPNYDKNVWGPNYWFVMHQTASQFPDKPARADKEQDI